MYGYCAIQVEYWLFSLNTSYKLDYKDIIGKDVSFLEAALEEDLLLAVESLIDTDAISGNIPENSSQPWNLTVRDQNFHYQVVIELGRDTIKSVKCNCVKYKKG